MIDANDLPIVDPGYNRHPADIAVQAAALKMADKASKTSHLADKFERRLLPDPALDLQDTKQARKAAQDWYVKTLRHAGFLRD